MQISIIRHPPVLTDKSLCHGQYDFPIILSQEDNFLNYYKTSIDFNNSIIYSSPLKRCLNFALKFGKNVTIENRIKEFHYGDWEGKKWEDINAEKLDLWMKDFENVSTPNGESYLSFVSRIKSFIEHANHKDQNLIVVTHAGVMRVLLALALDIRLKDIFDIQIGYGSTIQFKKNEKEAFPQLIKFIPAILPSNLQPLIN